MRRVLDPLVRAAAITILLALVPAHASTDGPIRVYDSTEIAFTRYQVLKRLWVQDWKSAFRVGGHNDVAAARAALLHEAARLGADAVVNLYCLDRTDGILNSSGHYCYGNAVKIKRRD